MKLEEYTTRQALRSDTIAEERALLAALMDISKRLQRLERAMREYLEASLFIREGDEKIEDHTGARVHTHAALCVGDCAVAATLKVLAEQGKE